MSSPMLLVGTFVHTPSPTTLVIDRDYLLVVDAEGFISHFQDVNSELSEKQLRENTLPVVTVPEGCFVIPSFCDLHLHAPQFLYQGNGLHLPLMQWLDQYALKAEERLDADKALAERVYDKLAKRLIQNGTGTILLFGTIKTETNLILAKAMQEAGLRAFVGKLSMDISSRPSYVEPSAKGSLDAARDFAVQCKTALESLPAHRQLVEPVLTPRFVPTCSESLLQGLGELSQKRSLKIQSHLAEAADQVDWVRKERGKEDIEVFEESKLLTTRTIQAHCTFLDDMGLGKLHEYGTAVAHCPLSNAYFSAEPFHLREALRAGVKVGLGTDVAGGYSLDIMTSMRQAVAVSRMREGAKVMKNERTASDEDESLAIDWIESLFLATRGGPTALGLRTGIFEVGAPFDAQQIKLYEKDLNDDLREGVGNLEFFDETDLSLGISGTMVEKWWCLGDNQNREQMWIQGVQRLC